MKRALYITLVFAAFVFSGCWPLRLAVENINRAITDEPGQVPNKIKNPIRDSVELSALWAGHSTVLLQMYDKVLIVDPVLEDVIAGVMLRKTESGLDLDAVPKMDAVLLSHAHMDHMSLGSINELAGRFPGTNLVFPRGVENYLPSYDMNFIRLNTGNSYKRGFVGESTYINGVKITAVYAMHFGGRYGLDSYLWNEPGCTGYIIEYKDKTVFYAGDTGYDADAYKSIGDKYKIDLALIPVGPCRECDSTGNFNHVASRGALMMFDDLKADYMIPVHYGAIGYFNEPDYPLEVLKELIEKENGERSGGHQGDDKKSLPYKERIVILKEGEQREFKSSEE